MENIDEIKNKEELLRKISKEKYQDEYFIEKAILTYEFQQGKTYTFFRDDSKDNLINKYNWCQRPHKDNMSLHRFISNGEIEAHMSESLAEHHGLTKIDLEEFIFRFVQPIVKENVELKSRLKTAERMNDVLAEQNIKSCEWYYSEFDNYTKDDFIEWARKKVEDE